MLRRRHGGGGATRKARRALGRAHLAHSCHRGRNKVDAGPRQRCGGRELAFLGAGDRLRRVLRAGAAHARRPLTRAVRCARTVPKSSSVRIFDTRPVWDTRIVPPDAAVAEVGAGGEIGDLRPMLRSILRSAAAAPLAVTPRRAAGARGRVHAPEAHAHVRGQRRERHGRRHRGRPSSRLVGSAVTKSDPVTFLSTAQSPLGCGAANRQRCPWRLAHASCSPRTWWPPRSPASRVRHCRAMH